VAAARRVSSAASLGGGQHRRPADGLQRGRVRGDRPADHAITIGSWPRRRVGAGAAEAGAGIAPPPWVGNSCPGRARGAPPGTAVELAAGAVRLEAAPLLPENRRAGSLGGVAQPARPVVAIGTRLPSALAAAREPPAPADPRIREMQPALATADHPVDALEP